jgi:hypothetical protein
MSGPFFTEGSFTKNSSVEVNELLNNLKLYSSATTRPASEFKTAEEIISRRKELEALKFSLVEYDQVLNIPQFMGKWYVLHSIPTSFEVGMVNCVEEYVWNEKRNHIEVRWVVVVVVVVGMSMCHQYVFMFSCCHFCFSLSSHQIHNK